MLNNEFMGTVVSLDEKTNIVTVEDGEGNCFDMEAERLEIVDGY